MLRFVLIAFFAATPALGQSAQGDVSVTIYHSNLALVQDVRRLDLPAGVSRQEFPDVSASIRPETVTLTGEGFGIVEQNFDFDLLSPTALMQKAIGQTVTLLRTNPATGAETRERATVLAVNGGVVLRIGDRIEVLRDDGLPVRVIFDTIPPNLRARPTLSVTLEAARPGPRPLTLSYLTTGLGWKADYVAMFDEGAGKVDVQGWITLTNATGTTFANAATLLVAGDAAPVQGQRGGGDEPQGNAPGTESAAREQVGDFYLYPIAGRTTIANAQTKQVSFLDVAGAAASKSYEFRNAWMGTTDSAQSASTILKFTSSRSGGLGDALPAGIVRVYMRDARGQAQFVGESPIPHTPMGSSLGLKTGEAFDVKVRPFVDKREKITPDEWEQSARFRITENGRVTTTVVETQKEYWRTTMRYVLTNARSQPVTVDLIQAGLDVYWRDTRVTSESLPGRQLGLSERLWQVAVPANGETVVTVVFETRN
jgi:hypothetical protein